MVHLFSFFHCIDSKELIILLSYLIKLTCFHSVEKSQIATINDRSLEISIDLYVPF